MKRSYKLIGDLIESVNVDLVVDETFEAVRAYKVSSLPIPLTEIYLSFAPEKITVSYTENESGQKCEKSEFVIRISCFTPLNIPAYIANDLLENVAEFITEEFNGVTGFTIGGTEYESNMKSYRQKALITFVYVNVIN